MRRVWSRRCGRLAASVRGSGSGVRAPARGATHGMAAASVARGGREAGGTRWSGSWRGRDGALAVGIGARSERHPGAHVQASDIIDCEFTLTHLYSNIGSSSTSGNKYVVNFRLNHLSILR
jgi:hypothetical protein